MFANAEGHKLPLESDGIWLNKVILLNFLISLTDQY